MKNVVNIQINRFSIFKKSAFTLAETLITIAIIGVVAALVIPSLMENVQSRAWSEQQTNFNMKINEAMNQMKTGEVLTGYPTSADFVDAFKGYMKVLRTCDSSDMESCFVPIVKATDGTELVVASDITTGADFGKSTYKSPLVGVQFNNGIQAMVAYNPDCAYVDPYNNKANATSCLSMLYDLNGTTKPNTVGKDIVLYHIDKLGPNCAFKIGSTCYSPAFMPVALTYDECNAVKGDLGIHCCLPGTSPSYGTCNNADYWAGAVKACAAQGMRLPTTAELEEIAYMLYPTRTPGSNPNQVYGTMDRAEAITMGLLGSDKYTFGFWANEEKNFSGYYSIAVYFQYTGSYYMKNTTLTRNTAGPDILNASWASSGMCVK